MRILCYLIIAQLQATPKTERPIGGQWFLHVAARQYALDQGGKSLMAAPMHLATDLQAPALQVCALQFWAMCHAWAR